MASAVMFREAEWEGARTGEFHAEEDHESSRYNYLCVDVPVFDVWRDRAGVGAGGEDGVSGVSGDGSVE